MPRLATIARRLLPSALAVAGLALGGCLSGGRLAHFPELAPAPGDPVPEVTVTTLDGETVDLAEHLADQGRPVVLQVGSVSCPVFRYRRFGMERLVRDFGDRVSFLLVYTREAHPVGSPSPYSEGEWDPWINRLTGVRVDDADTSEERRARAEAVRSDLELPVRVLLDPVGDPAWNALGRAPSAAFVIDRDGRVVAGQLWVRPRALRHVLREILGEP